MTYGRKKYLRRGPQVQDARLKEVTKYTKQLQGKRLMCLFQAEYNAYDIHNAIGGYSVHLTPFFYILQDTISFQKTDQESLCCFSSSSGSFPSIQSSIQLNCSEINVMAADMSPTLVFSHSDMLKDDFMDIYLLLELWDFESLYFFFSLKMKIRGGR